MVALLARLCSVHPQLSCPRQIPSERLTYLTLGTLSRCRDDQCAESLAEVDEQKENLKSKSVA